MLLAGNALFAQSQDYRLTVQQKVLNDTLAVELYVQSVNGDPMYVRSGTFSLHVDTASLDVAAAIIDESGNGPFTFSENPTYYWNPAIGKIAGTDVLTLNIYGRADAPQMPPVQIDQQQRRLGRMLIPIKDQCGTSNITWRKGPMTLNDWSFVQYIHKSNIVEPAKNVPLCSKPQTPAVAANGSNVICPGDQRLLTTDWSGEHIWFKDGVALPNQTQNALVVDQPGEYYAVAVNCLCQSDQSQAFKLEYADPPAKPVITAGEEELATAATGQLQWFFEGAPIPNATDATFEPTQNGEYTVEVTGNCGTAMSDPIEWNKTFTGVQDDILSAFDFTAYPNPYLDFTTISYTLMESAEVNLTVFDLAGKRVSEIVNADQAAGEYSYTFGDEQEVAEGTYMLRISVNGQTASMKLVELR